MSTRCRQSIGSAAVALTLCVAAAAALGAQQAPRPRTAPQANSRTIQAPPSQTEVCTGDLGTAVRTAVGLTVCSGAAQMKTDPPSDLDAGALVAAVDPGSRAEEGGLKTGDILYNIAGERVRNGKEAADRLKAVQDSQRIIINYQREGKIYLAHL